MVCASLLTWKSPLVSLNTEPINIVFQEKRHLLQLEWIAGELEKSQLPTSAILAIKQLKCPGGGGGGGGVHSHIRGPTGVSSALLFLSGLTVVVK